MWDEITTIHSQNFNGCTVESSEWIRNFINTHDEAWDYLSMLESKLNHVSKRGRGLGNWGRRMCGIASSPEHLLWDNISVEFCLTTSIVKIKVDKLHDITKKVNNDSEMWLKISVISTSTLSIKKFSFHRAIQTISSLLVFRWFRKFWLSTDCCLLLLMYGLNITSCTYNAWIFRYTVKPVYNDHLMGVLLCLLELI